jgi:hypothetical protein
MSLWDLLTILSGAAAVGTSFEGVRHASGALTRLALVVVGVLVGALCTLAIRRVVPRLLGARPHKRSVFAAYAGAIVWVMISALLGTVVTGEVLSILGNG